MTTTPANASSDLPGKPPVVDLAARQAAREELLVRDEAHPVRATRGVTGEIERQRGRAQTVLDGGVAGTAALLTAALASVNLLADESDQLCTLEQERQRLSAAARKTGIRIRDRLDVDHVLDTACSGIGEVLAADYVFHRRRGAPRSR